MEKFALVGLSFFLLVVVRRVYGAKVPAIFVFGDSLVDPGNNNNFLTIGKANFPHHGIDFPEGPTGRFCNGATILDYLGFHLEFGLIPALNDPSTEGSKLLQGVNFASTSAGILDYTGYQLGQRIPFSRQVDAFAKKIIPSLSSQALIFNGEVLKIDDFLAKSLFFSSIGNNDLLNNYFLKIFNPLQRPVSPDFEDTVVAQYAIHLTNLYNYGARKFLVTSLAPLGCTPSIIASYSEDINQCYEPHNEVALRINMKIKMMIQQLNKDLPSADFLYWDVYSLLRQNIDNPSQNGFKNTHTACCGAGRANAQTLCSPITFVCLNRTEFIFWDAFHPTAAVNKIAARIAYEGTLQSAYPMNVKQLLNL